MNTSICNDKNWANISKLLPAVRHEFAKEANIFSRKRELKDVDDLLKMTLLYAWQDESFVVAAAIAAAAQKTTISGSGLYQRAKTMGPYLEHLIKHVVQNKLKPAVLSKLPYQIMILDTTSISLQNSKGSDYRIHVQYNLLDKRLEKFLITDKTIGETFANFNLDENTLQIADRGLAHRNGIAHLEKRKVKTIVRFPWSNLPLETLDGEKFDIIESLKGLKPGEIGDWEVRTIANGETPSVCGRVVAEKRTPTGIKKAIAKCAKDAGKKGREVSAKTLVACEYFFLFTTLAKEEAAARLVLDLYPFRWQIELFFKLIKSKLNIDHLRCAKDDMVRVYLLVLPRFHRHLVKW